MDLNSQNKKVIILELADKFSISLRNLLLKLGFDSQIATIKDDVHAMLSDKEVDYFLIALCGSNEKQCISNIRNLIEADTLFEYPILVIGKEAHLYEAILNRSFLMSVTLSYPYKNDDIITGLKFLERLLNRQKNAKKRQEELKKNSNQDFTDNENSTVNLIFDHFLTLGIEEKNLHGEAYITPLKNLTELGTSHLPSENQKLKELVATICANASEWGKKHLHRVAYLTTFVLSNLAISNELKELAKSASFLYAWSIVNEGSNLLKTDWLGDQSIHYKESFSKKILDANSELIAEHQASEISDILLCMVDVMNGEVNDNSEIAIIAATILLADMVDKACWQGPCWNPRAGYRIFNTFKSTKFIRSFHPAAVCCILKILSESLLNTNHQFYLADSISKNPLLVKEANDTKKYIAQEDEEKVKISSLTDGMKLSKPLKSFDGKEILEADLTLDNDLIWRIWQLSSICPLNSPMVIKKNMKKKSFMDLGENSSNKITKK